MIAKIEPSLPESDKTENTQLEEVVLDRNTHVQVGSITQELVIHEELRTLLPPLSDEEFSGLEADILEHGCLSPVIAWNDILVDGHHRYKICTKHEIPFSIQSIIFDDLDTAKLWAWKHQEHRRNLTSFHRAELALKFKDTIAAKAKKRQGSRTDLNEADVVENSPQCKRTRQELAEAAGVSDNTIAKVEYIAERADEDTKQKLRSGEKGTSINKVFESLKARAEAAGEGKPRAALKRTRTSDTSAILPTTDGKGIDIGPYIDPETGKRVPTIQLNPIPHNKPEIMAAGLMDHFPLDFAEGVVLILMQMIRHKHGEKRSDSLMASLNEIIRRPEGGDQLTSKDNGETTTTVLKSNPKVNENYSCGVKFEPDPDDDFYDWISDEERAELFEMRKTCPNRLMPQIHNFTIQNIPEHKPDQLINCLFSLFKPLYRRKLLKALLRKMHTDDGMESVKDIVLEFSREQNLEGISSTNETSDNTLLAETKDLIPNSESTTLKPILKSRPDLLVKNVIDDFPKEFAPDMVNEIFQMLQNRYGSDVTAPLAAEIHEKFGS